MIKILTVLFSISATIGSATEAIGKVNWQDNRLVPLQKITVGPWDNFEATLTPDDQTLYFTRDRNQIPTIYRQHLSSTQMTVYIESGDAKQPELDTLKQRLAITYYEHDAQGDVCIVTLATKNIKCITSTHTVDESPFWIDQHHLGFLSRQSADLEWQLMSYDLQDQTATPLHKGFISTPTASPDGQYILFSQVDADGVHLYHYNRQTGKLSQPPAFDLPGTTGFTAFSSDGQYLYFNHYLNDTNFDQIIDGNDHSVVFRVKFSNWLKESTPLLPEQLTSVENNCKFPTTTDRFLYVTCAFEGTLDIYRIPLTGVIPLQWDNKALWEAHLAARSYQQRLLILNTLRYRKDTNSPQQMLERLLSNHLEIGELSAASYYINKLTLFYHTANQPTLHNFYHALDILLKVRSSKQRAPAGVITAAFQKSVKKSRQVFKTLALNAPLNHLINAQLDYELGNRKLALTSLDKITQIQELLPLEQYLVFELRRNLLQDENPRQLLDDFSMMFNNGTLPLEARLYYAFNYLVLLSTTESNLSKRSEMIEAQANTATFPEVIQLFSAERHSLQLISSQDDAVKANMFKALTNLLKQNKDDLRLRKVMHTRAIQILGDADQFKYMELLSRHWLLTTHVSEMEFVNVADQYSVITMDKAYGMMANQALANAYVTFYSAIRQTNDLEAHYQFITLGLSERLNKRDNLDKSYAALAKQAVLGPNENYAKALRLIIENQYNDKALSQALALLKPMPLSGLNPAMRDLLMAYIYHQQFRASKSGFRYNKDLFQKAHFHYMMALDLGRFNTRISASVWENLAWLNFEVRQYALSSDFFLKRSQLPFTDINAEANTRWFYARSLFYNNQAHLAWKQAKIALTLAKKSSTLDVTPFIEKVAFYAMQAGNFSQALIHYKVIFAATTQLSDRNHIKAALGYGYTLLKLKRTVDARQQFNKVLRLSENVTSLPANELRLISSQPQRWQLLTYGFLAKLSDSPQEKIKWLGNRIEILKNIAKQLDAFAYKESGRLSYMVKDYQNIALAYEQANQFDQALASFDNALKTAVLWSKETDDQTGPVLYRTLINHLSMALSHPQYAQKNPSTVLFEQSTKTLTVFTKQTFRSERVIAQQTKLQLIWEAYRSRILRQDTVDLSQRLKTVLASNEVTKMQTTRPNLYTELQIIARSLGNL